MATTTEIRALPSLWYKLNVLLFDLHHFSTIPSFQQRLESVITPFFIGAPYFTTDEVSLLLSTSIIPPLSQNNYTKASRAATATNPTSGPNSEYKTLQQEIEDTLKERLERRMKKRVEIGDYRVCAAHDVAPILSKAFGLKGMDLEKNKVFLGFVEEKGLEWTENMEWEKTSVPAGKGKNSRGLGGKKGKK